MIGEQAVHVLAPLVSSPPALHVNLPLFNSSVCAAKNGHWSRFCETSELRAGRSRQETRRVRPFLQNLVNEPGRRQER